MRELNKEAMFPKDNISENTKMMRDMIITPIPLFELRHSQGNNIVWIEAQVCCAHKAKEE